MAQRRVIRPLTAAEQEVRLSEQGRETLRQAGQLQPNLSDEQIEKASGEIILRQRKEPLTELFIGPKPRAKDYVGSKGPRFKPALDRWNEIRDEMVKVIAVWSWDGEKEEAYLISPSVASVTPAQKRALDICADFLKMFASGGVLVERNASVKVDGIQRGYRYWLSVKDIGLFVPPNHPDPRYPWREVRPIVQQMEPMFSNPDSVNETGATIVAEMIAEGIPVMNLKDTGLIPGDLIRKNNELLEKLAQEGLDNSEDPEEPNLFDDAPVVF